MPSLNNDIFINRSKLIHGDKYDYSMVEYCGSQLKIAIICHKIGYDGVEHGVFLQTPNKHLCGRGCPKCCGGVKKSLVDFIDIARQAHGNKYDYSKAKIEYVNSKSYVVIICPKHGEFKQKVNTHLSGKGCYLCGRESTIKSIRLSNENFILKSNKRHNFKYSYDKTKYINSLKSVIITCSLHGDFKQVPSSHLIGHGCPKCGKNLAMSYGNDLKLTLLDFVNRAKKVHGNKYDYSKVNYISGEVKVIITCNLHGDFKQIPSSHLTGHGCPKCAGNNIKTNVEFIDLCKKIHGSEYIYDSVNYINNISKINIICKKHGLFKQNPNSHLNGHGCPKCCSSRGEKKIGRWLSDNSINYEPQKKYMKLKGVNNGYLRYDFCLPDHNILIEYDGRQHFDKRFYDVYFKGDYYVLKKHDRMKSKYCKKNNIKLIRIPYWDYSKIEKILNGILTKIR